MKYTIYITTKMSETTETTDTEEVTDSTTETDDTTEAGTTEYTEENDKKERDDKHVYVDRKVRTYSMMTMIMSVIQLSLEVLILFVSIIACVAVFTKDCRNKKDVQHFLIDKQLMPEDDYITISVGDSVLIDYGNNVNMHVSDSVTFNKDIDENYVCYGKCYNCTKNDIRPDFKCYPYCFTKKT